MIRIVELFRRGSVLTGGSDTQTGWDDGMHDRSDRLQDKTSVEFGERERQAAQALIDLALAEDLGPTGDLTSEAVIDPAIRAQVAIVARETGVLAGLPIVKMVFDRLDPRVQVAENVQDGEVVRPGRVLATLAGPLRSLLAAERTALNFLIRMSGVATMTRRFVDAIAGSKADILDTRKTLPGWRVLDKYAVRMGGGINHRMGLYDEVLIKDNHLAAWQEYHPGSTIADVVRRAREQAEKLEAASGGRRASIPIGVEVDTLDQLRDALRAGPDLVLLDNMDVPTLRRAVQIRNQLAPTVKLEASGNVTLANVAEIAATGVDRISIGSLTHSARALDIAFDWHPAG